MNAGAGEGMRDARPADATKEPPRLVAAKIGCSTSSVNGRRRAPACQGRARGLALDSDFPFEEMDMRKAFRVSPLRRPAITAAVASLAAAAAQAQPLAPNVQKAAQIDPPKTRYVVVEDTLLYRVPTYDPDKTTGETLKRGQRPEVLGEASDGLWILIGKGGTGIGYASRSLLCPVDLCPDIKS
jgi:hypothetical protein